MNRVLVDTNVLVSGLVFGGKPRLILVGLAKLGVELVGTDALRDELFETLTEKFGWQVAQAELACAGVFRNAHWVKPETVPRVCRDADDDFILPAAAAAKAQFIVTGDQDLLSLIRHGEIEITAPGAFLARIKPTVS